MKLWGYYAFHTFINSIKKMFRSTFIIVIACIIGITVLFGVAGGVIGWAVADNMITEYAYDAEGNYVGEELGRYDEDGNYVEDVEHYIYDENGQYVIVNSKFISSEGKTKKYSRYRNHFHSDGG